MHNTVTYKGKKIYYVDSAKLNNPKVVLASSSKLARLSTLTYDLIDKTRFKEVGRVNCGLFENDTKKTNYGEHYGWEYSDVFKTSCGGDTRADVIRFKDGTYKFGDINKNQVDLNNIDWAYSGSHIVLQDGKDVCIVASWRTDYPKGDYCWSFFATRDDGSFVIGALDGNHKINTNDLRDFLKSLGCTNAMINDGGGSAELIVGKKVVNRTSERAIANGLFVYEDTVVVNDNEELKKYKSVIANIKKLIEDLD